VPAATPAQAVGAAPPPHGGSREHTLLLRALHPGTVTIQLALARSFEPRRAPRESLTLVVRVVPRESATPAEA
jgi:hypothetical protein